MFQQNAGSTKDETVTRLSAAAGSIVRADGVGPKLTDRPDPSLGGRGAETPGKVGLKEGTSFPMRGSGPMAFWRALAPCLFGGRQTPGGNPRSSYQENRNLRVDSGPSLSKNFT
jgi:hypothetical protein